jgi:hypothetical protein
MGVSPILVSLLLAVNAVSSADTAQPAAVASYHTAKNLPELQTCLTDKLSERGNVTAATAQGTTILMLREGEDAPMLIELDPPSVRVTTQFAYGTRKLVEHCL